MSSKTKKACDFRYPKCKCKVPAEFKRQFPNSKDLLDCDFRLIRSVLKTSKGKPTSKAQQTRVQKWLKKNEKQVSGGFFGKIWNAVKTVAKPVVGILKQQGERQINRVADKVVDAGVAKLTGSSKSGGRYKKPKAVGKMKVMPFGGALALPGSGGALLLPGERRR